MRSKRAALPLDTSPLVSWSTGILPCGIQRTFPWARSRASHMIAKSIAVRLSRAEAFPSLSM
eukprot:6440929-Pyramimonas_sp.AAC.1